MKTPSADALSPSEAGDVVGEDRSPGAAAPTRHSFLAGFLSRLRPKGPALLRQDLTDALLRGTGDGAFSTEERAMLNNILRLREVRIDEVMVPRAEVEAVEITATLGELMQAFEASGHSRMPVYGENLDDPRGMVHIRDVLAHITASAQAPRALQPDGARAAGAGHEEDGERAARKEPAVALDLGRIDLDRPIGDLGIIREVLFVPPSMLPTNLMARMQATRTQMALVIDEYGGTDGLVSLEDIIEMVVGDIEDEHDESAAMIVPGGDGIYLADARADLGELRDLLGEAFEVSDFEEEVDTIGGLLFYRLGRVPARGEVIRPVPGFEFQILDADRRRVRRVRITRVLDKPAVTDAEAP